ncbi:probable salivary secreted peptide [Trichogramma pretiosum]|uniref:probable salivary secreted peptide n=1 Tax=Trichogramma pretiosum TaxID=7493 RepID=UPI0006C9950B|nr:probable salivary secreted peptide [Trichogramma pretiosum]
MKSLLLLLVGTSLFAAAHSFFLIYSQPNSGNHDLIVGGREYNDRLIYSENVTESFQWSGMKLIINRTVEAPPNFQVTQVKCINAVQDGTGAEANIVSGGPGLGWVTIRFKSQRWRGIYFGIEVYARPTY